MSNRGAPNAAPTYSISSTLAPVRTHFLHIRKTGGMAVKAALRPVAAKFDIVLHNHNTTLADVPAGERAFFTVREPAARFVSGFNSRLRQGRPLFDNKWSEGETAAFQRFTTPNDLAEALSSKDSRIHANALAAMRDIRHVNALLGQTLRSPDYVTERLRDIVWILFTETLGVDFDELKRRLGLPAELALPDDDLHAHRTPEGLSTELSALGRRNVDAWYAEDRAFVASLRKTREKLPAR